MAIDQDFPYFQLNLDIQHPRRQFHATVNQGDTPAIRAYLYQGGKQYVPPDTYTTLIAWGSDFEDSTTLSNSAGQIASSTQEPTTEDKNYIQFDLSTTDTANDGDYYCQIQLANNTASKIITFPSGFLHILKSPIGTI